MVLRLSPTENRSLLQHPNSPIPDYQNTNHAGGDGNHQSVGGHGYVFIRRWRVQLAESRKRWGGTSPQFENHTRNGSQHALQWTCIGTWLGGWIGCGGWDGNVRSGFPRPRPMTAIKTILNSTAKYDCRVFEWDAEASYYTVPNAQKINTIAHPTYLPPIARVS